MPGIQGKVCSDPRGLKKIATRRRKHFCGMSIKPSSLKEYEKDGWKAVRPPGKTSVRIQKPKPSDEIFEDMVWDIFYRMGFHTMNEDRHCYIAGDNQSYRSQIDVLAGEHDNVFIVECASSEGEGSLNARNKLETWHGRRNDLNKSLRSEWGRVNIAIALSSPDKRDADADFAKEKGLFLWSQTELHYLSELVKQVGPAAKYQFYSVIFTNKKAKHLKKEVLAIECKMAGKKCYSFMISAKDLLKYAYVHHRGLTNIVEASQAYQRMLRKPKIKQIVEFLDKDGGYFPNTVIVNFLQSLETKQGKKEDKDETGNVKFVHLVLPPYYGCAWIIDGQHRLYGAAKSQSDPILPVLAFDHMNEIEQANLFVEINKKQTSVPGNLLWDLYTDIYKDSEDEKQRFDYQVAKTAKFLAREGALAGHINVPSRLETHKAELTLTTICDTIKKYSPWENLKHPKDDSRTPANAARIIGVYYNVLSELWPEDWKKGDKGVLLSNNGFGVFMMVFHDIIKHINYKDKENLLRENNSTRLREHLCKTYVKPMIEFLKSDLNTQKEIRKGGGRGLQSYNAGYLDLKIQDFVDSFTSSRIPSDEKSLKKPTKPDILDAKCRIAEKKLREFVLDRLISHHGQKWWHQGMPSDPKDKADEKWIKEKKKKPYKIAGSNEEENKNKFEFCGLGELMNIVIYKQNWEIFVNTFGDKDNFQHKINEITAFRNAKLHERDYDAEDIACATAGLLWLSNRLGNPEINPYT